MTLHLISSLVVLLVVAGLLTRRNTALHMRFMTAAFAADLGLVLYIEGTRQAIETVVAHTSPLVWFHAGVSTLVLALYVAQLTVGRRMLAGRSTSRRLHIALGLTFCLARGLNYATAFIVSGAAAPPAIQAAAVTPERPSTITASNE
jgi:uncharacterized membrane protein YozB (DUF420 family)